MKKINSINELTNGQKVYLELTAKIVDREKYYPLELKMKDGRILSSFTSDLRYLQDCKEEQNIYTETEPLEIGKEYEFSTANMDTWRKDTLVGYRAGNGNYYSVIRPIQQSKEELKAIELLKSLGYKVEK